MRGLGFLLPLLAALGLSACSSTAGLGAGNDISSRAETAIGDIAAKATVAGDVRVTAVEVVVPRTLRVSESMSFYPMGTDIVWRGDPRGNRHAQVAALFEAAGARAAASDAGAGSAIATVTLERFHGVTERTRFTVGGFYSMRFTLSFRDAATGAPLGRPVRLSRTLTAPGGRAAVELDAQGQTEKVRVTDYLARELAALFALPPGTEA